MGRVESGDDMHGTHWTIIERGNAFRVVGGYKFFRGR
jgi:hypothetical protein